MRSCQNDFDMWTYDCILIIRSYFRYDALRKKLFGEHVKRYYGNENEEKMVEDLREEEKTCRANREKLQDICKRFKVNV